MKILHLISSSGFFGAENVVLQLSTELVALGHEVTIGIFYDRRRPNLELAEKARTQSLMVQEFECRGRLDWATVNLVSEYIKVNEVQIIHSHGYKSNFYAALANFKVRKPMVSTCHNWIMTSSRLRFYAIIDKLVLRTFDVVVPVSAPIENALLAVGISQRRVRFVGNGINVGNYRRRGDANKVRYELGIRGGDVVIGTIGRLTSEKGHSCFLAAAREVYSFCKTTKFLIIGDGKLMDALRMQATELGLAECVLFLGKRDDISALLSAMDIFVLPSLVEGQPMALFEAMASETPVVATAVGDVPLILKHGELGLVVPPNDPVALANGILSCMNDRERAGELARKALDQVSVAYSSSRMASEYAKIYCDVNLTSHAVVSG